MTRPAGSPASDAPTPLAARSLIEQLPHAIIVIDGNGRFSFANAAAEELLQRSATRLIGMSLVGLIAEDDPLVALIDQVRRTGRSSSLSGLTLASPRIGTHRDVEAHARVCVDAPGHVLLVLQERSTARQIERQLGRRNAGRSVSGLAGVMAHEIRNPLAGIRGAAQLIEPGLDADGRALTSLICTEIDRIARLLDRMLAFGEGPPRTLAPVNIHSVLDQVLKLCAAAPRPGVRISAEYDPSLPDVLGNHDRLVQALLNLVRNAIEAAGHAGRPRSAAGHVIVRTAFVTGIALTPPGGDKRVSLPLMIAIEDDGPGVPEEITAHLFEPFVTSKPKGTGLGLALSAKIVSEHGGLIEMERVRNRTVFRVLLPLARDARQGDET